MQKSDTPLKNPSAKEHYATTQKRSAVRKDIWFSEDQDRLHYRIFSPRSTLIALPKKSGYEVVEEMEHATCLLQENVGKQQQELRYFEADKGTYRYANHEFLANSVLVSLFRTDGLELPERKPDQTETFMNGVAKEVTLTLSGSHPNFHAEKFKANVQTPE